MIKAWFQFSIEVEEGVLLVGRFIPTSQRDQEPEHQQYSKKANNRRAKPDQYPDDENQTGKDLH